jgi:hypothetical protein
MDQITVVSLTVGGLALLAVPLIGIWIGSTLRGKAADEAEKRHAAEKELWARILSETVAVSESREKAIKRLEQEMHDLVNGVRINAEKINEREKILGSGGDDDAVALSLLRAKSAAADNKGAGSNPGPGPQVKT